MRIDDLFLKEIEALTGEECWGVVGGEGTGSIISLSMGNKLPRKTPLNNPYLSEAVRDNESQFGFMIYCPWRIESNATIIAGSRMPNHNDGPMVSGLSDICNVRVVGIECVKPAYDLRVHFDNGMRLVLHCSNIETGLDDRCYVAYLASGCFTVLYNGKVIFEPLPA